MRRFKTARMEPGCDPTVFFASLQKLLDRALPGLDGVSRQQLSHDQFVQGLQLALRAYLRLARANGQLSVQHVVHLARELAEAPLATFQSQEDLKNKVANSPNSLQPSRRSRGGTLERADATSVACLTSGRTNALVPDHLYLINLWMTPFFPARL
ncbi:gap-Pol polyprotein [Clonorchis sinensis]|uniref:Gap-Pol polyprotein n=1 Tax=Clonorchis sinensis TaxID=79923 RepID=G7Y2F4_CLOSI|nr:gap-Pol polyprotein [Clonorchis sinensis]